MISRSIAFGLLLLATASAFAEDPSTVKLAGYHLSHRSSFNASDTVRPPFWPIGWVHRDKAGNQAPVVVATVTADMFSVTSILMGRPSLVTINGRSYAEGEFIRAPRKGDAVKAVLPPGVRAKVMKIVDGSVTLAVGEQTLNVPLRRAELNEHKEEDLLNSDDQPAPAAPAPAAAPAVTSNK